MFKKKGLLHWDILLVSSIISILIIAFYSNSIAAPSKENYRGEFSVKLMEERETKRNTISIFDDIVENTNRLSLIQLTEQGIPQNKDCGDYLRYVLLNDLNSESCIDSGFDPEKEFVDIFEGKFQALDTTAIEDLDISDVEYNFSVEPQDDEFFVKGDTDDRLKISLTKIEESGEERIGTLKPKAQFKIKSGYDFDEYRIVIAKINDLIEACKNDKDAKKCIERNKNTIFNADGLELKETCEAESKENLLDFAEYILKCSESDDNNCVCRNRPEGYYNFNPLTRGIMLNRVGTGGFSVEINAISMDSIDKFSPNKLLHRDLTGNLVISLNNFEKSSCRYKPDNKFRFCVRSTTNTLENFDEDGKLVTEKAEYKFALQFPEEKIGVPYSEKAPTPTELSLEAERFLIYSECKEKENTLQLAEKVAVNLQDQDAQVVLIRNNNICDLTADEPKNIQTINDLTEQEELTSLIVISADSEADNGLVEHHGPSIDGETMSFIILNSLNEIDDFSGTLKPSNIDILSATEPRATKVTFTTDQINNHDKYVDTLSESVLDYIDVKNSNIEYGYYNAEEPLGERKGIVDLDLILEIARQQDVNYYLLASVIETESGFLHLNIPNDGKAHGLGQQFVAAITDIYPDLKTIFPELEDKTPEYIYQNVLTSTDENDIKIQITATALYLDWIQKELERRNKPTDTQTIIQAYHDGAGNIREDGTSILAENSIESFEYYPRVKDYHDRFIVT